MLSQVKYSDLPSYQLGYEKGVEVGFCMYLLETKFNVLCDDEVCERLKAADVIQLQLLSKLLTTF